jgi:hypothetical protein
MSAMMDCDLMDNLRRATDQESVCTQLQALGASILGTASLRGRTNTG